MSIYQEKRGPNWGAALQTLGAGIGQYAEQKRLEEEAKRLRQQQLDDEQRKRDQYLTDFYALHGQPISQGYMGQDAAGVVPGDPVAALSLPQLPDYQPSGGTMPIPAASLGLKMPQPSVGPAVRNVAPELDPNVVLGGKSVPYAPWMQGMAPDAASEIYTRMNPVPKQTAPGDVLVNVVVQKKDGGVMRLTMKRTELDNYAMSNNYGVGGVDDTGTVTLVERADAPKDKTPSAVKAEEDLLKSKIQSTVLGDVGQATVTSREVKSRDNKGRLVSEGSTQVPSVEGGALLGYDASQYFSNPADVSNAYQSALTDTLTNRALGMGVPAAELYGRGIPLDARQNALTDVVNTMPTIADPRSLDAVAALEPGWVFDDRGTASPKDDRFVQKNPGKGKFNDKKMSVVDFLNSDKVKVKADAEGTIAWAALNKMFHDNYGVSLVNLVKSDSGGVDESLAAAAKGKK